MEAQRSLCKPPPYKPPLLEPFASFSTLDTTPPGSFSPTPAQPQVYARLTFLEKNLSPSNPSVLSGSGAYQFTNPFFSSEDSLTLEEVLFLYSNPEPPNQRNNYYLPYDAAVPVRVAPESKSAPLPFDMTTISEKFPQLGRTLTDVLEDELYHPHGGFGAPSNLQTLLKSNLFMYAPLQQLVSTNSQNNASINWLSFLLNVDQLNPLPASTVTQAPTPAVASPFSTFGNPNLLNDQLAYLPDGLFGRQKEYTEDFMMQLLTLSFHMAPDAGDQEAVLVWPQGSAPRSTFNTKELFDAEFSDGDDDDEDMYFEDELDVVHDMAEPSTVPGLEAVEFPMLRVLLDGIPSADEVMGLPPMQQMPVFHHQQSQPMVLLPLPPSSFESMERLQEQTEEHHCTLVNPATGVPCQKLFSRPYDLVRHQETIHAQRKKIFRCLLCDQGKTFLRGDALLRHIRVKHELAGDEATRAIAFAKENVEYVDMV